MEIVDSSNYVYIYFYPNQPFDAEVCGIQIKLKPFYVGVGKNNRWKQHLTDARNKNNTLIKHHIIRKIWNDGENPTIEIVKENMPRNEALKLEADLVSYFGKQIDGTGILANMVDGGRNNPILPGKLNPMYGKRIPDESIRRAVAKVKLWREDPLNKPKLEAQAKKISIANSSKTPEEQQRITNKRIETLRRNNPNILIRRARIIEERWIRKLKRLLARICKIAKPKQTKEDLTAWRKVRYAGCNNPMFGNGHKLKGILNGRAKIYKINIDDLTFIIHGALKKFCKEFKAFFKTFDPLRSNWFINTYNVSISEIDENQIPNTALIFKDSTIFEGIQNDKFKKRKNCED